MVRGEIYRVRAPRDARRSQQRGVRYAVVVQADEFLGLSTVLVAPTSTSAPVRSFRPALEIDGTATRILVEQMTAVSSVRLGDSAGRLSASELRDLDEALALLLGL